LFCSFRRTFVTFPMVTPWKVTGMPAAMPLPSLNQV
jgi:hypothetical protein